MKEMCQVKFTDSGIRLKKLVKQNIVFFIKEILNLS